MRLTSPEEAAALYGRDRAGGRDVGRFGGEHLRRHRPLGGKVGFIGKVGHDQFARVFAHDIRSIGVVFSDGEARSETPTGRCLILVTPDGERTMNTNLGAASEFADADLDRALIEQSQILYLEGYLFDPVEARAAFHTAADIARPAGAKVAFTLSDPFCVDRHRDGFRTFIRDRVDIVFANERELLSLYPGSSFDEACAALRTECEIAAITRSEKGAVILHEGGTVSVPAVPIEKLVDATGAGDLYAAGFLFGLASGRDLEACGRLGSLAGLRGDRPCRPAPEAAACGGGAGARAALTRNNSRAPWLDLCSTGSFPILADTVLYRLRSQKPRWTKSRRYHRAIL